MSGAISLAAHGVIVQAQVRRVRFGFLVKVIGCHPETNGTGTQESSGQYPAMVVVPFHGWAKRRGRRSTGPLVFTVDFGLARLSYVDAFFPISDLFGQFVVEPPSRVGGRSLDGSFDGEGKFKEASAFVVKVLQDIVGNAVVGALKETPIDAGGANGVDTGPEFRIVGEVGRGGGGGRRGGKRGHHRGDVDDGWCHVVDVRHAGQYIVGSRKTGGS